MHASNPNKFTLDCLPVVTLVVICQSGGQMDNFGLIFPSHLRFDYRINAHLT